MTSAPPLPIGYAKPVPWHRRRVTRRWLYIVIAVIVVWIVYTWGPFAVMLASRLYWQRQCLAYASPPSTIVYSTDPADVTRLGGSGYATRWPWWTQTRPFVVRPNVPFQQLSSANSGNRITIAPAAFVGGRSTPSGNTRIVAVQYGPGTQDPFNRLFFSVYAQKTGLNAGNVGAPPGANTTALEMFLHPHDVVRLYDGRLDPSDRTRFTIDYDLNGVRGTIDGAIDDASVVTLTPRTGRCAVVHGRGLWSPSGAPMPDWVDGIPSTRPTAR